MAASSKKVLTVFPCSLLKELDEFSKTVGTNRSELIRRAVTRFLELKKELSMIEGYEKMGRINSRLAEEALTIDERQLKQYEHIL